MADTASDFSSPVTTPVSSTAPVASGYNGNGEFAPKLSEALANMDTELMHQIVTRECSTVLSKKIDEFVTFLRRLSLGNKAIFKGVVQQPAMTQKLEILKNEVDNFSHESKA